jgi:hypothetical protein
VTSKKTSAAAGAAPIRAIAKMPVVSASKRRTLIAPPAWRVVDVERLIQSLL